MNTTFNTTTFYQVDIYYKTWVNDEVRLETTTFTCPSDERAQEEKDQLVKNIPWFRTRVKVELFRIEITQAKTLLL
jgi:hypothetical protein